MNEAAARDVLLVRAIETTDVDGMLLPRRDRDHAGRTAAELARWDADTRRAPPDAADYFAHRARLLLDTLGGREPALRAAAQSLAWRPWIDAALALVALAAGLLFDRLGDRGHVNVLAFPLLALLLWNGAVYALLAAAWLGALLRRDRSMAARIGPRAWLRRLAERAAPRRRGALAPAFGRFADDWMAASARLTGARLARALHLAAALFALGAVAGLYVRGLVFDYRAGWESTFLGAATVHALLSAVLGPAAHVLGHAFPDVAQVEALRFQPGATGDSAARWIHWYALTVFALVVLPRLLLAGWAAWRAHRLATSFPLDLHAPYFRRTGAGFARAAMRLRVLPYSYTLDAAATAGLHALARTLFGEHAVLDQHASIAFGEEARAADALAAAAADEPPVALDLALFSLAATPEQENHGAFLDALRTRGAAARAMLVDEGPYARRLGPQAGSDARLAERRAAWRAFGAARGWPIAFADLAAPDLPALERDLEPALARTP